ncbi:hypothetical protein TrRE_jg817 [Triparma retinervis]|uniref:Dynein light chain n=1 Tax=Triparma retinervis TaxID=2557542 RepID=A0A9W7ECG5_9STRA|nr:hypothetical protein TrRE_jg817 [Triparma retinervis]
MLRSCGQAIKGWEAKNEAIAEEAEVVKLYCQIPPITKIGIVLNPPKLRILALGRNAIKKLEKLDELGPTLEQLWVSYNQITNLDGLSELQNLTTLFISNNNIKSWAELDKLAALPALKDILLVGNPIYDSFETPELRRVEVLRHLPQLSKIDGQMVKPAEREAAMAPPE